MALLWRVFPWSARARPGDLFAPDHLPAATGRGRFDLPADRSPVLYLAESAEHAVAEALQPFRNRPLRAAHLERAGHPLALVQVELSDSAAARVLDLCDPRVLVELRVGPDRIASLDRAKTQSVALAAWDSRRDGLRWWSAFSGDWHGWVLFTERAGRRLAFGTPQPLDPETPALRAAAAALGMTVA